MGNPRKLKRIAAKSAYQKFVKEWKEVRERQDALSKTGTRQGLSEKRRDRMVKDGDPVLGRRPTFREWWKMVKTQDQARSATPSDVQEHQDLNWDE